MCSEEAQKIVAMKATAAVTPTVNNVQPVNIDEFLRWTAVFGGTALAVCGLKRRSVAGLFFAGLGGLMVKRCLSGACKPAAMHYPHFEGVPDAVIEESIVDEASWESFPASDPPAYSQITN